MKKDQILSKAQKYLVKYSNSKSKYYEELKNTYNEYKELDNNDLVINKLYSKQINKLCIFVEESENFLSFLITLIIVIIVIISLVSYTTIKILTTQEKVKVVIDLGNGTTSIIAKEIYNMFPMDVEVLFGDSDPMFPNHHPDPCVESNLEALKKKVVETHADLGIGFDGDGDRLGVIDEKGTFIPTDKYMIIIIRDIIDKVEKKKF